MWRKERDNCEAINILLKTSEPSLNWFSPCQLYVNILLRIQAVEWVSNGRQNLQRGKIAQKDQTVTSTQMCLITLHMLTT